MLSFSLEEKVAIVTGAANGMGRAIACGLADQGVRVVGVDYQPCETTKNIIEEKGGCFFEITANLMEMDRIPAIIEKTVDKFGRVDILVNCAGIIRRESAFAFSQKDWDDVIDIDLKAVFLLCQAAANEFRKEEKTGKIVNIASLLAFQGGIRVVSYAAAKSGIAGITKALANEWAQYGINVNAIAPGYIATDLNIALQNDPVRSKEILVRIPAGRWGKPEDVVGTALYLCSPASDYVHGVVVPVDGGWLAR